MERSGVLPTTKFANRKCLATCDALLCMSHTLQSVLESGHEARILQIDFSVTFGIGQPSMNILYLKQFHFHKNDTG